MANKNWSAVVDMIEDERIQIEALTRYSVNYLDQNDDECKKTLFQHLIFQAFLTKPSQIKQNRPLAQQLEQSRAQKNTRLVHALNILIQEHKITHSEQLALDALPDKYNMAGPSLNNDVLQYYKKEILHIQEPTFGTKILQFFTLSTEKKQIEAPATDSPHIANPIGKPYKNPQNPNVVPGPAVNASLAASNQQYIIGAITCVIVISLLHKYCHTVSEDTDNEHELTAEHAPAKP